MGCFPGCLNNKKQGLACFCGTFSPYDLLYKFTWVHSSIFVVSSDIWEDNRCTWLGKIQFAERCGRIFDVWFGRSLRLLDVWIKWKYFQWVVQNRNFKNICWLGSQRKVKCKCNLDSSIDSPGEGWNVLIFWWKWKINILTISRNTFSIFYWLEISKSFCFLETLRLNLKTSKCLERCYFLFLS